MRNVVLGAVVLLGSSVSAFADIAYAPSTGITVLFHEAEADENGCHTAKRKRHNFHCHESAEAEILEEVDVTEAAGETKVAAASN